MNEAHIADLLQKDSDYSLEKSSNSFLDFLVFELDTV